MSRVSARARPTADRIGAPPGSGASWLRGLGFAAAAAAVILGIYLAHPIAEGYRFPLGPDGPVYAWWARFADVVGLDGVRRPGIPGATLVLGEMLRTDPLATATLLGPILALATGLAAAALTEAALGPDLLRAWAAAIFAGAFAGALAPGWLANLGLAALFLGAAAALWTAERSWRGVWLGAGLLAAGGLAHAPFLAVSTGILALTLVALAPSAARRVRLGEAPWSIGTVRMAAGTLIGGGGGLLAAAALGGGPRAPGDTSQDQLLRRAGFGGVLRSRFRERLSDEAARLAAPLAAGLALGLGGAGAPDRRTRGPGRSYVWALLGAWAAITAAGVGVLWVTGRGPAARMLTFAFFVPIAAAVGFPRLARKGWAPAAGAALLGLVLVGGSMWGWYRQRPYVETAELRAATTAGRAVEALPPGTPIVFVVDTEELAAGFHLTRFGNVIRTALPADRLANTSLAVGGPRDFLEGRPGTTSDDPEYEAIARAYLNDESAAGSAVVLVVRAFNEPGFEEARRLGTEIAGGVVLLAGPEPPAEITPAPDDRGLGPGPLVGLSVAAALLLGALGAGWARWGLAGASPRAALALAPSAGLGVAILGAFAADGLGLAPGGPSGLALAGLLAALGYLAAVRAGHQPVEAAEDG